MTLIVIPLATAEDEEYQLKSSIFEMMGLLRFDAEARDLGRDQSSVALPYVVPWHSDWEVQNQGPLVQKHFVLAGSGPGDTARGGTVERLRYALSEGIKHASRENPEGGAVPVTLVIPVLVLTDENGTAPAEGQLQGVYDSLDEVADLMVSAGMGRTRLAAAGFRVMPWVYSSRPMVEIPDVFFAGPKKLGTRDITPVLYSALAASGHHRTWAGYGQTRLITDLLALQALSGDADSFKKHFPIFQGTTGRRCYYLHSSFFEYPLNDLVREHVLTRLSSGSEAHPGQLILPTPERLQVHDEELNEEIERSVETCRTAIRQVIEEEAISAESFVFGPTVPANTGRLSRPINFRRIILTQDRLSQLSTSRYADHVHDNFYAELKRCTAIGLEKELRKALDKAHQGVTLAAQELEGVLQSAFGAAKTEGGGGEPTDRAVRKSVAMIDRISSFLADFERELENKRPERPEELLSHARKIREPWLAAEEGLLKEAGRLPLAGGRRLEVTAVFAGLLALLLMIFLPPDLDGWQGWAEAATIVLLPVGAAFWIRHRHRRDWLRYHAEWEALSHDMSATADDFGKRLARLLDLRIRLIKYSATGDLKRSLRASRERFITELAGFHKLVEEEVAERKLQRTRRARIDERYPPHEVGRFRVQIDEGVLSVEVDGNDLQARLGEILNGALRLTEMPRRATLDEHQAVLRRQAELALEAASSSVRQFAETAEELLVRAMRYGFDDNQLSAPGEHIRERSEVRLLLVGQRIEERLKVLPIVRDRQPDAVWKLSHILPSETAVAVTVQTVDIEGKPS